MPGEMTNHKCPRCGSPLLSDGKRYWCSFVGGGNEKACSYGLNERIEMFEGQLCEVVDGARYGWWRFHEHYDRNGYCDNPGRGY